MLPDPVLNTLRNLVNLLLMLRKDKLARGERRETERMAQRVP